MKNAIFLIDGFNLYHSLINPLFVNRLGKYKWLNLKKMCLRFLQSQEKLNGIYYFSALCEWDEKKKERHEVYINALINSGVTPILGKFKLVTRKCRASCKEEYQTYEEKRTDVNIGVKLISFAFQNTFDVAYLISADSDLIPAVEEVRTLFDQKEIVNVIPFGRSAEELTGMCNRTIKIKEKHLKSSQFDLEITTKEGITISCPNEWR